MVAGTKGYEGLLSSRDANGAPGTLLQLPGTQNHGPPIGLAAGAPEEHTLKMAWSLLRTTRVMWGWYKAS